MGTVIVFMPSSESYEGMQRGLVAHFVEFHMKLTPFAVL